jgi:hypothetical protein
MKTKNRHDLEWLLDYELNQSARHRRFVSLVMLSLEGNGDWEKLDKILDGIVRYSDALFFLTNSIAVLMGETDNSGALKAVERYQEMISAAMDVRYAIASFPNDGKAPMELIYTADRRLTIANTLDRGSIVAKG